MHVRASTFALILLALVPHGPAAAQAPAAAALIDAAITIVKTNALRADTVDWTTVEPEVRGYAAGARQASGVYPAIQLLLSRLGDHHSFFMRPAAASEFKSGGAQNPPADVRALPDGVGYIGVPAYGGTDRDAGRAYARRAHEAIAAVKASASCGWVVDLRTNSGGNMWPMLSGLRPLVGSGVLGSFEGRSGRRRTWTAADPPFDVPPAAALRDLEFAWVAVLTGPQTGSSSEFVAIASLAATHPRAARFVEAL